MRRRHPLPTRWLFTDERQGNRLWRALARLPRGGGVVFRHYHLPPKDRRALFGQVQQVARRRGLLLLLAGSVAEAIAWRADGIHGSDRRRPPSPMLATRAAHRGKDLMTAARDARDAVFLSPLFETRSHPETGPLGTMRFAALTRRARLPVIALGGTNEQRWPIAKRLGASGYAAIDGWETGRPARVSRAKPQKRKAVPI